MERRTALKLLAGGTLASRAGATGAPLVQIATKPESYELLFFADDENMMLERLTEMIIPADERSGGALEAHLSYYMDWVLAHSRREDQISWRDALGMINQEARRRFGNSFLGCDADSQDRMMRDWAEHESSPRTKIERFFVRLKATTVAGYYTTRVGLLDELGYEGNTAISTFPGCTHERHG